MRRRIRHAERAAGTLQPLESGKLRRLLGNLLGQLRGETQGLGQRARYCDHPGHLAFQFMQAADHPMTQRDVVAGDQGLRHLAIEVVVGRVAAAVLVLADMAHI
ncbi:hypothetical protein D3C81_2104330 [compost metagenome]